MGLISVTNIADGTNIDAQDVNSPINTIVNEINGNLSEANLANSAATTAKIADSAVTTAKIADANVTTAKILDTNVTAAKLATALNLANADTAWHLVGDVGEPAFANSWVNHTVGTYTSCGFRKDAAGYVHLQGLIKNGTVGDGTPPFQLPVGYRPLYSIHMVIVSLSAVGNVRISPDGYVRVQVGNNSWVSLDGLIFKAEQ